MDDIRYTNFDVSRYWATQTWQYTDFRDVPHGIADKIIIFPRAEQTNLLHELIPDDFTVHVSEGRLWMLMAPHANKKDAVQALCSQARCESNPFLTRLPGDDGLCPVSDA